MERKLPLSLRNDLDDSKVLVSTHNASLGEAWARAVVERKTGRSPKSPASLLKALLLESEKSLRKDCPKTTEEQCWNTEQEVFTANDEQLDRVRGHLETLRTKGIDVRSVTSEMTCTGSLNVLKAQGIHRFMADLHSMERLVLKARKDAAAPLLVTCGKVGGIGKYGDYFGPLNGRLHSVIEEGRALSSYYFPHLGEIRFMRDADSSDPLVMLASLVGKYVRELTMKRISRFYAKQLLEPNLHISGYHDPVTTAFVKRSSKLRKRLQIVQDCFERRPAKKQ